MTADMQHEAETQGDRLRKALAEYRTAHGHFPWRLRALELPEEQLALPCGTEWFYSRFAVGGPEYTLQLGCYEKNGFELTWDPSTGGWYWDT